MVVSKGVWGPGAISLEHPRFGVSLYVSQLDSSNEVTFEMNGCSFCPEAPSAYLDRDDRRALILHLAAMDPDVEVTIR